MAEITQSAEIKKKSIRTSADIFGVLCSEIEKWVAGTGEAARSKAVCQIVTTQIALTRLQMDARHRQEDCNGIPLLEESSSSENEDETVARLSALGKEKSVLDKALDDDSISDKERQRLEAKRNNVQQEIVLLERPRRTNNQNR